MSNLIPYILKLSISLAVIYLFYQLFLRRLTFYNWNRWYLLLYSLFCFALPFINVFTFVTAPAPDEPSLIHFIPVINYEPQTVSSSMDWKQWAVMVFLAGIIVFLIRLLIQYRSLLKMRTHAKLLYDSSVKLYHIDKPVIPFSFGNAIYINQHQHSEQELSDIIRHEFIHVKQRHTVDMLWSELLCILNWYNPFAWLLKKAIRQNLEFIADHQVLQTGFDRKQYQYLLLKVIGAPAYSIASNFNFSSLKKRIAMMNKSKSARVNLIRFLFIIPLLAVILLAFRNNQQQQQNDQKEQAIMEMAQPVVLPLPVNEITKLDTVPDKPKKQSAKKGLVTPSDIERVDVRKDQGKNTITITLKNGEVEIFDVENEADRKRFKEKFGGELPNVKNDVQEIVVEGYASSSPLQSPAINDKGYYVSVADNYGECVVIIKNKDRKIVEAVTLNDWEEKEYEKKYGKINPPQPIKVREVPAKPASPAAPKPVTLRAAPAAPTQPSQPAPAQAPAPYRAEPVKAVIADWSVVIDRHTTREKLETIKQTLSGHGHTLTVEDISYTDGLLTTFNALITSDDGSKGNIRVPNLHKGVIIISGGKDKNGKKSFSVHTKADNSEL